MSSQHAFAIAVEPGGSAPSDTVTVSGERCGVVIDTSIGFPLAALRSFMGLWRGITGMDSYRRYLGYQRVHHPECDVMSEAEFWRRQWDDAGKHPRACCC